MVSVFALNARTFDNSLLAQIFLRQETRKVIAQRSDEFCAITPQIIFDVIVLAELDEKLVGVLIILRHESSPRFLLNDIMAKNLRQETGAP